MSLTRRRASGVPLERLLCDFTVNLSLKPTASCACLLDAINDSDSVAGSGALMAGVTKHIRKHGLAHNGSAQGRPPPPMMVRVSKAVNSSQTSERPAVSRPAGATVRFVIAGHFCTQ